MPHILNLELHWLYLMFISAYARIRSFDLEEINMNILIFLA